MLRNKADVRWCIYFELGLRVARLMLNLIQDILSRNVKLNSWQAFKNLGMDFVDLWRCGRIRCLHLIRIASCKTWSCSYSTYSGFEFWVLRFRDLGASFSRFGCFVFEFWVLRFRDLGASFSSFGCFVLRSSFSSASFSKLQIEDRL